MEFVEVTKQRERMCDYMCDCNDGCEYCPLSCSNNSSQLNCSVFVIQHPEEAEKIIMKWAEEHPIKTNGSKFLEDYPNSDKCGYRDNGNILYIRLDKSKPSNAENNCIEVPAEWWNKEYKEVSEDAVSN